MSEIVITDSFSASKPSYERFADIQTRIENSSDQEIAVFLNMQNRVGYTFLFLFSTLPYLTVRYNKSVQIHCNEKNYKLLKKLGFLNKDSVYDPSLDYGPMLKSNVGLITEPKNIFSIVTKIPQEAPVKMSPQLASIFISRAGEMYNNAMEHSHGVVLGAKYFRNQKNTYCFSCYDTGVGIPANVMSVKHEISTQIEAFKWAMVNGNSTVGGDIPRGLGLGLLKSFVRANEGTIRICSDKVLYIYRRNGEEIYHELKETFHGTLFEMDIIADNDRKYILK